MPTLRKHGICVALVGLVVLASNGSRVFLKRICTQCRNNDVCSVRSDNDDASRPDNDTVARSNDHHHGRRTTVKPSFIFFLRVVPIWWFPNTINSLTDVMIPRVGTTVGRAGCVDSFSRALFAVSVSVNSHFDVQIIV